MVVIIMEEIERERTQRELNENEGIIYLATTELEGLIKKVVKVDRDTDIIREMALLGENSVEAKSIREALRRGFTNSIMLLLVNVLTRDIEGNEVQMVDNYPLGRARKVSNTIAELGSLY